MTGQEGGTSPDFSAILGKLMENPSALSALTNLLGNAGKPSKPPDPAPCPPPPVPTGNSPTGPAAERRKLLLALKPFVSPKRRDAIDRILQANELISLFRKPTPHQGGDHV